MGGLVGSFARMWEIRKGRAATYEACRGARAKDEPRMAYDPDFVLMPKRPCRVHGRVDRCWRKRKDAHG